jgi:hypothetical protein
VTINKALTINGPRWVVSGGGISRIAVFGDITFSESHASFIGIRAIRISSVNAAETALSNTKIQRCIIDTKVDLVLENWSNCSIEGKVFTEWNADNLDTKINLSMDIRKNVYLILKNR